MPRAAAGVILSLMGGIRVDTSASHTASPGFALRGSKEQGYFVAHW